MNLSFLFINFSQMIQKDLLPMASIQQSWPFQIDWCYKAQSSYLAQNKTNSCNTHPDTQPHPFSTHHTIHILIQCTQSSSSFLGGFHCIFGFVCRDIFYNIFFTPVRKLRGDTVFVYNPLNKQYSTLVIISFTHQLSFSSEER